MQRESKRLNLLMQQGLGVGSACKSPDWRNEEIKEMKRNYYEEELIMQEKSKLLNLSIRQGSGVGNACKSPDWRKEEKQRREIKKKN